MTPYTIRPCDRPEGLTMPAEITLRYSDADRTWQFVIDGARFAEANTEGLGYAILTVARERPGERIVVEGEDAAGRAGVEPATST